MSVHTMKSTVPSTEPPTVIAQSSAEPSVENPTPEMSTLGKLVELENRLSKVEMEHFVLRYKHRGAPKMLEFASKNLETAILRGRQHCQTQGYKFIYVEPVYLDLDTLDMRMENGRRREEEQV